MSAPTAPRLTGLVLAGGTSRRMGRDKAAIVVEGEPLALRLARRLEAVADRVLIASGDGRRLDGFDYEQVADPVPTAGPLAGIVAGLEAATTPLVAVVAVDLPFADAAVLRALSRRWAGEVAVVPSVDGRVQPLHGVYAAEAAGAFRAALEADERGVTGVLERLGACIAGEEVWGHLDGDGRFAVNVNDPQELAAVLADTSGTA